MKITLSVFILCFVFMALNKCAKDSCEELKQKVCSQSKDSESCKKAEGLTNKEECRGYLKDVDKFILETTPMAEPEKPAEKVEPAPEPVPAPVPAPSVPPVPVPEAPAAAPIPPSPPVPGGPGAPPMPPMPTPVPPPMPPSAPPAPVK